MNDLRCRACWIEMSKPTETSVCASCTAVAERLGLTADEYVVPKTRHEAQRVALGVSDTEDAEGIPDDISDKRPPDGWEWKGNRP